MTARSLWSVARSPRASEADGGVRPPLAVLGAVLFVTIVDLATFDVLVPLSLPPGGLLVRFWHHGYLGGRALGFGALLAGLLALRERFGPRPRWLALLPLLAATLAMAAPLVPNDAVSFSARYGGLVSPRVIRAFLVTGVASSVPLALEAGIRIGRLGRSGRVLGMLAAGALTITNHLVLRGGYESVHLFLGLCAIACSGGSLVGARLPWLPGPRARAIVLLAATLAGVAAFVSVPRGDVALAMYRSPGTHFQPLLARLRDHAPPPPPLDRLPPELRPREGKPPVPPTEPRTLPPIDTVVLLSLDALRADVPERYADRLPNLTRVRRASLDLALARSAGSQTLYTFTSLFTGKFFCQLLWKPYRGGDLFPSEDPSVRFPRLLGAAGINTVSLQGNAWFTNPFGVMSGFRSSAYLRTTEAYTTSPALMKHVVKKLESAPAGEPLMIFTHLMDAHEPYDLGGTQGAAFERYLRELEIADRSVGLLVDAIDRSPRSGRTMLLVMSDHGEAFGEHGLYFHAFSVYEELLRVPLWIRAPGVTPRRDGDTQVTLLDVGPTILDAFGLPTPGAWFGQTLMPLLQGKPLVRSRPIAAEDRRKQALVYPDHTKVICDRHRGTVEVYDLNADPREMHNLVSGDTARYAGRIQECYDFFDAIRYRAPGYETPFRQ